MNKISKALVGSATVIVISGGIVLMSKSGPIEGDLRAKNPEYASVLTGDSEHDHCVLQRGPQLSASRKDYVAVADAVCKAGVAISAARHP